MEEKIIGLLKTISEDLEDVVITPETELISGGFIESFDIIGLISELENTFHIDISFDDIELEQFNTVASIAEVVSQFGGAA
ncbi:MAG: acyl carrier protein [Eubacterium sp.]|nr:acyl carrier protein [Eubacterium sp.]